MWQEIITYAILAITFGTVGYKSIIRPVIRLFTPRETLANKKGISPVCATCAPGLSCENCAFYNPRPATYRYKNGKSDFDPESGKAVKNTGTVRITPAHYTGH